MFTNRPNSGIATILNFSGPIGPEKFKMVAKPEIGLFIVYYYYMSY